VSIKEALCQEFCDRLRVRQTPAGLAVGTQFLGSDGDPIGFYVVGPDENSLFRVEDSGATVPILEANGADLELDARAEVFRSLLQQYQVEFDEETFELRTKAVAIGEVPKAALRFVNFLIRAQDIVFLSRDNAENTFKQEAVRDIKKIIGANAKILLNAPVLEQVSDVKADLVIRAEGRQPVGVFLVRSDSRLYEAIMLQGEADYKLQEQCSIIALLEDAESVTKKAFMQALNRVTPLTYRGQEAEAMMRIKRDALGAGAFTRH